MQQSILKFYLTQKQIPDLSYYNKNVIRENKILSFMREMIFDNWFCFRQITKCDEVKCLACFQSSAHNQINY
jgi:hypothetical protein